jgi:hypothetical protein
MYRDVTHIAGPGSFYISAALFTLFGTRFEVGRIFMLVLFAGVTAALYGLSRRLTGRVAAALVALWFVAFRLWSFPHWQMLHYASIALAFAIFAFYVLHAERPVAAGRAAAAGLLAGAAMLTKQDSGALATLGCAGALVLGVLARARRRVREPWLPVAALALLRLRPSSRHRLLLGGKLLWLFILQTAWDTLVQHPLVRRRPRADLLPAVPELLPLFSQDQMLRRRLLAYMPALFWDLHWTDVGRSWLFQRTNLLDLTVKVAFRVPYVILLVEAVATVRAWRREQDGVRLAARTAQLVFAVAVLAALSKPRDWIHLSVLLGPIAPIAGRQLAALAEGLGPRARGVLAVVLGVLGASYLGLSAEPPRARSGVRGAHRRTARHGVRSPARRRAAAAGHRRAHGDPTRADRARRPVRLGRDVPRRAPVRLALPVALATGRPRRPRPAGDREPRCAPRRDRRLHAEPRADDPPRPGARAAAVRGPRLPLSLRADLRPGRAAPDHRARGAAAARPRARAPARGRPRHGTAERAGERLGPARSVAGVGTWPLTPRVLWVSPASELETRIVLPVVVPPNGRLRLRAGVNPDLWQAIAPFPVRLRVAVDGDELLSVRRDVFANPGDRV